MTLAEHVRRIEWHYLEWSRKEPSTLRNFILLQLSVDLHHCLAMKRMEKEAQEEVLACAEHEE